jgi:hypothetical protein
MSLPGGSDVISLARPNPLPKIVLSLATIVCCAMLLHGAFYRGVQRGMDAAFDEPGFSIVALAAAIGDMVYGNSGYVADYELNRTISANIIGNSWSEAIRPNLSNAVVLNNAIRKGFELARSSNPSGNPVISMYFNDLGFIDFIKLAFRLFGEEIQSLYRLFFVLLGASVVLFVLAFPGNIFAAAAVVAVTFAICAEIDSAMINYLNRTVYGFRFPSVLAVLPTLHLGLLLARRQPPTPWAYLLALGQVLLLIFAIKMRGSAEWGLIALIIIATVMFLQSLWANWRPQAEPRLIVFNAAKEFARWPLVLVVGAVVVHSLIMKVALHPIYDSDDVLPHHVFWHTLFQNYAPYDLKALALAGGATGDEIGYRAGRLYAESVRMANTAESLRSPLTNTHLRIGLHDKLMRRVFLNYAMENPVRVLKVFAYDKPLAAIRLFMRMAKEGFPTKAWVGAGIIIVAFSLALYLLPWTLRERSATVLTLSAMTVTAAIPPVLGAAFPYFYLAEIFIVLFVAACLGLPFFAAWAFADWVQPNSHRNANPERFIKPAILLLVCMAFGSILFFAFRSSPQFETWSRVGVTVEHQATKAPDGTWTGTKIVETTDDDAHEINSKGGLDSAKPAVAAVFAKAGAGRRLLTSLIVGPNHLYCEVDLETGAAATKAMGEAQPGRCAAIKQTEGWWLVEVEGVVRPSGRVEEVFFAIGLSAEPFVGSYRGDGKSHIFVWGASLRQGN